MYWLRNSGFYKLMIIPNEFCPDQFHQKQRTIFYNCELYVVTVRHHIQVTENSLKTMRARDKSKLNGDWWSNYMIYDIY